MKTNTLQPQWILVARIGWVLITFFFLTTFILGLPYRYSELVIPCDASDCPPLTLSSTNAALINATPFSMQAYASFHIGLELITASLMSGLAGLIFWRYFDNLMGILTAYLFVYIGLAIFVLSSLAFAVQFPPVEWLYIQLTGLFIPLILLVIYIFPNGRFLKNLTRLAFVITLLIWILDGIFLQFTRFTSGDLLGAAVFLGTLAIGIWFQIYRYRNISTAIERQQTKWVLLGITGLVSCMAGWSLMVEIFPPSTPQFLFLTNTIGIAFIFLLAYLFPISMMIAIMRYGLWGIDVIIRRTVQYSIVTALLAAVYFGSITLIQRVFTAVSGTQSPLAIVLSTLLIAALFNPLRQRVQAVIDRRFYRKKYNAQQILARFAQTARDEVEIDVLQAELGLVVEETMHPEHISVWIKPGT